MGLGDDIARDSGAEPLEAGSAPMLEAMTRELCRRLGLPRPTLWLLVSDEAQAWVAGETAYDAALAVTTGGLSRWEPLELRAVLAHELGHIKLGHLADRTWQVVVGKGVTVARYGRMARSAGGLLSLFLPGTGLVLAAAGTVAGHWGRSQAVRGFGISQQHEHGADDLAGTMGLNAPLATALVKITRPVPRLRPLPDWLRPLLFSSEAAKVSTHPLTAERVRRRLAVVAPSPTSRCPSCFSELSGGTGCPCGGSASPYSACACGAHLGTFDRFCGSCGAPNRELHCRVCLRAAAENEAYCACGCALPTGV